MITLDINTPRGQLALQQEQLCARVFERYLPRIRYVHTPKDAPCRIDALLVCDDALIGVVEQKSRFKLTLNRLRTPKPQNFSNI